MKLQVRTSSSTSVRVLLRTAVVHQRIEQGTSCGTILWCMVRGTSTILPGAPRYILTVRSPAVCCRLAVMG